MVHIYELLLFSIACLKFPNFEQLLDRTFPIVYIILVWVIPVTSV